MPSFEFDGEKYKQASKHQKEWGNKLIAQLNLKGNEAVLDLGCGDGILTEQIARLVPKGWVVGDVVFSNAALHWIKNHKKLLENSLRALKPGGNIAWNFASNGTCTHFNETVKAVMDMPAYKTYFAGFEWPWYMPDKEEYTALMEKAGFAQFEVCYENVDRFFSNSEEMIRWINQPSLVPFMQNIPENQQEPFRNQVVKRMLEKTQQADGRCFETFRRLNVKAVK